MSSRIEIIGPSSGAALGTGESGSPVEVLVTAVSTTGDLPADRSTGPGTGRPTGSGTDRPRPVPDEAGRRAAAAHGIDLDAVLTAEKVRGRAGEVIRVPVPPPSAGGQGSGLPARWLLVGVGSGEPGELRTAGAALARAVRGRRAVATSLLAGRGREQVRAGVEGLVLGGYTPPATGRKNRDDARPADRIDLLDGQAGGAAVSRAVALGRAHAEATWTARVLAATPPSTKTPAWMVEQARQAAAEHRLSIEVWDADRLAGEGFGGLVTVGAGSASPPALVRLEYRPASRERTQRPQRPVVLVGKGITFDTGGISLKPREAMVPMKTDMSGAGAVLATLATCRDAGVRHRVIGLLPLAENAISGSAYRPGDVISAYGGRSVEIANTDAEGRLVLADAIAYADARLDPRLIIDVATLTGAVTSGLGRRHAGLFTADEAIARGVQAAADASGERVWRLPLVEDYTVALRSDVADLRHVPLDAGIGGGAITAALFLRSFAGTRRWAHLDIAGVARSDKDENEVCKGATGFGARLLLRWLEELRAGG
ncbi:MAG: leucyl aminopeptidase family protein [Kineosporiaceae bacterium]|nr:leucyl aminopeptidase family protein [Kineosporiaceae bacterium]